MKKFVICLILAIFCLVSNAEVTRQGDTFKVEKTTSTSNDAQTKYTWEDKEGNKYPIYITKKGACYILRTSKKTGKEYKYYLPKDTQETIKKELNIQQ